MTGQHRAPDPPIAPAQHSPDGPELGAPAGPSDPEPVVRPFLMTGGRTTPMIEGLRIETLVHAAPEALSAPLRFELRTVVRLCQQPQSIAEIAAALHVPIGVARVVVGDLVAAGHASVAQDQEISTAVIERIRDLVRAL
ncbi:DUF742 domain-containing protein [Nocardia jiangxiensis]|uniref:DUF742 domain-containing protein n=1 Tax=Nocardia jiangxiensis TaxID=282685 RepID=A0ABW6SAE5_9NOCA|nr:DUF742 domain-containing protein [Nocardia jiangxiensis]